MIAIWWLPVVLLCQCWRFGIQPAACKPLWMSPQFPCDVKADNHSQIIFDCRRRDLRSVPDGITSNATELNLSENHIEYINPYAFSHLLNLTRLFLSSINKNKESLTIAPHVFLNLSKLRELKLSSNSLKEVPGHLPLSLESLELTDNNIEHLDNRSFTGVPNLTKLCLQKNCFFWNPCGRSIVIEDGSFAVMTKLKELNLAFNNLTRVPKGLPSSLHQLVLAMNRIPHIYKDDFSGLPNLKELKIQGNCPRCQTAPFPCVPCQNTSLYIHPNAFAGLNELKTLNLGGNSLKTLQTSWFKSLTQLKELYLEFNLLRDAIVGEAPFFSYLGSVEKMDLSFNFLPHSYPATINISKNFSKLVSLRTLHLAGMVFKEIRRDTLSPLYELKNLSALNLGTNFIFNSNSNFFGKFSYLKMIYLGENRLYPIAAKSPLVQSTGNNHKLGLSMSPIIGHHGKDFQLELTHGLIKQACFNAGRVLILSSNNLFFISPEQFEGYGDIACLNLSRNGFSAALNGTEFSPLSNLTYLDLSFNKIDLAYNNAFKELKKLEVLDLSYNSHYFEAYGVTHNMNFLKNLPALRVLNMSHNSISTLTTKELSSKSLRELQFQYNCLGTLWKGKDSSYAMLFSNLTNLTILDISYNKIKKMPKNVIVNLPRNLTVLHISHNFLVDFNWEQLKTFPRLEILDLSFNSLSFITHEIASVSHNLTLLDMSHNYISQLTDGFLKGAKSLRTLVLSSNRLTIINQTTFPTGSESQLHTLFLEDNPLQCTCDMLDFILWIESTTVKIPKLTTWVKCDTPANQKGQVLIKFDINQCVNDSQAFLISILSTSIIIVFMFITMTNHLFYWDATYVLHYLKAKFKGYHSLKCSDSIYNVFVTYDTEDPQVSKWVMGDLRLKLEDESDKSLPLCLEERDWTPGVPLLENLTQSIRYSRKTLFVLTQSYVKTGIFRLAVYLAHQRLLDENKDVIVLLMLEPVLQHSHFLRLRRRLCGKSVMEWPRTAAAEPWFWQNLKNVVRVDNQVLYNETYKRYFTSK
ncbi:toll-like receptor 8 [Thalassophryne amazonica]|uniref:toll-like receptor 8 n=1 Tax=Thalassophryne amazonica TaxID=390379 RepID=UPI0014726B19|nr:toll-like receptor 8 [Thalassophryne amazonica]XP_034042486.1 toll-like receptor 8 [Thalassophryne amazonica]